MAVFDIVLSSMLTIGVAPRAEIVERPQMKSGTRNAMIFAVALSGLIITALVAPVTVRSAEALPYLFEQLKKPAYKNSLGAVMRGQSRLPSWIGVFLRTMNGVASPGAAVVVEGQALELYSVCEPHNCGGNFLYVLYAPGGSQAWALVTKEGQILAVLGNPSAAQQQALVAATKQ
jgi:hypothetical protein